MSAPDVPDPQMAHFVKVCGFLNLTEAQTAQALAFLLGCALARLNDGIGPFTEQEWMDVVSEAAAAVTT